MINNKKVLAIIPARGGSKGVPRKNIRLLAEKPLIFWTIEEAKKSKYIDRLILSSEDEEIIEVAESYGCEVPFRRPRNLALDTTHGIEPTLHVLEQIPGYDYVVVLQPTSPLRISDDIDKCIEKLNECEGVSCVSVTEPPHSPYWMYLLVKDEQMQPLIPEYAMIPRRQELPTVYSLNGAVYVADSRWLQKSKNFMSDQTIAYIMPKYRSYDIDNEEDFLLCEWMMRERMKDYK